MKKRLNMYLQLLGSLFARLLQPLVSLGVGEALPLVNTAVSSTCYFLLQVRPQFWFTGGFSVAFPGVPVGHVPLADPTSHRPKHPSLSFEDPKLLQQRRCSRAVVEGFMRRWAGGWMDGWAKGVRRLLHFSSVAKDSQVTTRQCPLIKLSNLHHRPNRIKRFFPHLCLCSL